MTRARLALALLAGLALGFAACGREAPEGVGRVTDVRPELRQIGIDHEAIPGLMPAMTMNFDVEDPALLAGIAAGDRVRFRLSVAATRFRVVALQKLPGGVPVATGGAKLADVVPESDVAPDFALTDQDGGEVTLAGLRGSLVLLDFVYTSCPGPCPIQTSARVQLQRALAGELRGRVRFVSISLDPQRDTPAELRRYALARGVDLAGWSFLTGEPATVDAVLQRYGVGRVRKQGGEIEHVVVTFLIDPQGRIRKRYFGLDHATDDVLRDLASAARAAG